MRKRTIGLMTDSETHSLFIEPPVPLPVICEGWSVDGIHRIGRSTTGHSFADINTPIDPAPVPMGNWGDIIYVPSLSTWAAVGNDANILYSTDNGATWKNTPSPLDHALSIYYAANINAWFVLGYDNSTQTTMATAAALTSLVWSKFTPPLDQFVRRMTYAPELGRYFAVGVSYTPIGGHTPIVCWSQDGATWHPVSTPMDDGTGLGVVWASSLGKIVVSGSGGVTDGYVAMSSQDGELWVNPIVDSRSGWEIAWSPKLERLAISTSALAGNNSVLTSNDAITWTPRASDLDAYGAACVKWSKSLGLFLLGGPQGIAFSPDGIDWALALSNFHGTGSRGCIALGVS